MLAAALTGNRVIARVAISGFVRQGLGSNAIINSLRGLGLSYRRQTMLADIRKYTGLLKLENTVRTVAPSKLFPKYGMVETDLRRGRRYRIYGQLEVFNPTTGEVTKQTVSWYSMNLKSKDEWIADFMADYSASEKNTGEVLGDLTVTSVEHQKGWSY